MVTKYKRLTYINVFFRRALIKKKFVYENRRALAQ